MLRTYLFDTYTAQQGRARLDRATASAAPTARRRRWAPRTCSSTPGNGERGRAAARPPATALYVMGVTGLHSGVNPISGTFSVGATGRLIAGGELAEPVREMTIASDLVSMLEAVAGCGARGPLGPVRRQREGAGAADARDDDRRR